MNFFQKIFRKLFVDDSHPVPVPPAKPPVVEQKPAPRATPTQTHTPRPMPSGLEKSAAELLTNAIPSDPAPHRRPAPEPKKSPAATDDSDLVRRMLETAPKKEASWENPPPFHLCDGRVVSGPRELHNICDSLSQETFNHHVTADRNDFATWIADVFHDHALARDVRGAKTPHQLKIAIAKYLHPHKPPAPQRDVHVKHEDMTSTQPESTFETEGLEAEINLLREQVKRIQRALSDEIVSSVSPSSESVTEEALAPIVPEIDQAHPKDPYEHLVDSLARARAFLRSGDIESASNHYGAIRELFYDSDLSAEAKQQLHSEIKELYMDIELARLP